MEKNGSQKFKNIYLEILKMLKFKIVVVETVFRKSASVCKPVLGGDASQFHPHSIWQPVYTSFYTRWKFDTKMQRFNPRKNKTRRFENIAKSYF